MNGKLTRRQLAAALAPVAALAQTVTRPSADPEEELQAARERLKTTATALDAVNLPMATEPAFQFKA